jgi:hypothetical protein
VSAAVQVAPTDPRTIASYVLRHNAATIVQHIQQAYLPGQIAFVNNRGIDFSLDPVVNPPDPPHKGNWNTQAVAVLLDLITQFGLPQGSALERNLIYVARSIH